MKYIIGGIAVLFAIMITYTIAWKMDANIPTIPTPSDIDSGYAANTFKLHWCISDSGVYLFCDSIPADGMGVLKAGMPFRLVTGHYEIIVRQLPPDQWMYSGSWEMGLEKDTYHKRTHIPDSVTITPNELNDGRVGKGKRGDH